MSKWKSIFILAASEPNVRSNQTLEQRINFTQVMHNLGLDPLDNAWIMQGFRYTFGEGRLEIVEFRTNLH